MPKQKQDEKLQFDAPQGPIPYSDWVAYSIGKHAADALDEAHETGVVKTGDEQTKLLCDGGQTLREDLRPDQIQYQLVSAMMEIGEEYETAEDAPLHVLKALEHIETAGNLLQDPEITVREANPADPEWPTTFDHMNPELMRAAPIDRHMVAWKYSDIEELFEGNRTFALFCNSADRRALYFWEGEHYLFVDAPKQKWTEAPPETIIDWIGAAAVKEPGQEPLLVHRKELLASMQTPIERVQRDEDELHYCKECDSDVETTWDGGVLTCDDCGWVIYK